MLSIKDAKATLQNIGMTEDEASRFEIIIQPFIDFHKYLMINDDISSENAEKLTQEVTKKYINENVKGDESQLDLFTLAGKGYKEFALSKNYDTNKSELLESTLVELVEFFVKVVSKLQKGG